MNESYNDSRTDCNSFDGVDQLALALEPSRLYRASRESTVQAGRFALCHKSHPGGKLHQDIFGVKDLDWVMGQVLRMSDRERQHYWISQATLSPGARDRRISSIYQLNAVWIDIDLAHPPKGFDPKLLPKGDYHQADHLAALLKIQIEDAGLPEPTVIIGTGGGLCAKWIFDEALPATARARWQSLQTAIVDKIAAIVGDGGARWPVDTNACDAARILRLVGMPNPRWGGAMCRILLDSGKTHSFDYLADEILQYTREQVRDFRIKVATGAKLGKQYDSNRAAAAAAGIRRGAKAKAVVLDEAGQLEAKISDEAARNLWCNRTNFILELINLRGGIVEEGQRNSVLWVASNALAYSCTGADDLKQEIASLHHTHFNSAGYTRSDALSSASTVIRRLSEGKLYKMTNKTFLDKLEASTSEIQRLAADGFTLGSGSGHNKNREKWDRGAMKFPPMANLPFPVYLKEVRTRQALAGPRSAELRRTSRGQDVRAKAVLMGNSGVKQAEIAKHLWVAQGTVSKWLAASKTK